MRHPFNLPVVLLTICSACVCSRDRAPTGAGFDPKPLVAKFALDKTQAATDLGTFTQTPHPFGTPHQAAILSWLETRVKASGAISARQDFIADVPNPAASGVGPIAFTVERAGANIYAAGTLQANGECVVAIGTHVDTKHLDTSDYLGANDGGSSTVALLQQLAFLQTQQGAAGFPCDIVGIFFDGEEAVLPNWDDGLTRHPARIQDNTYGSRYAAAQLTTCTYQGAQTHCLPATLGAPLAGKPLVALILMDMIGSPDVHISRDTNSSRTLRDLAAAGAGGLDNQALYDAEAKDVEDDHMPFRQAGVAGLDLIDFNHLDYWHRAGDDPATISYESIDLASKLALWVALAVAHQPKVFLSPAE